MKLNRKNIWQWALLVLGFAQIFAFVVGLVAVRGIGVASRPSPLRLPFLVGIATVRGFGVTSVASPLPIVFAQFRGIETFALGFTMDVRSTLKGHVIKEITPAVYSRLHGPYNVRNVYAAAVACGPVFTSRGEARILDSVLTYGLCKGGPLSKDLDLPNDIEDGVIYVESRTRNHPRHWKLRVKCGS